MTETVQTPQWLKWARTLQALGQSGLAYCSNDHDRVRYDQLLGIAAEITAAHTLLPPQEVLDSFQMQAGYATPKVDVRGVAVRDGKVLLVQERADGRWCLPGGWADVGREPAEMVVREVREESGFEVKVVKVVGVFDANREQLPQSFFHAYKLIFLCQIVGGTASPDHEILAVEFFDFEKLPPLSENRTDLRQLREVQAHLADPSRATAFD